MENKKKNLLKKILIDFIKKNNYNILSIFTTNEKGMPLILKQNSNAITLEINKELEKILKLKNFSDEEIQKTITDFLMEYLKIINEKEKNDNSTV